jgi:hexosaminidase
VQSSRSPLRNISSFLFACAVLASLAMARPTRGASEKEPSQALLPVMPVPAHVVTGTGSFLIESGLQVILNGYTEPRLDRARQRFLVTLKHQTGILPSPPTQDSSQFLITTKAASAPVQELGEDESYHLEVSPKKVSLDAATPLGVLRGLQTFLQLVHTTPAGFAVASVTIDDKPRFPWRGLMIDTGRHFMPPEIIRQNLDAMEAVKLNVLHWHVSEDQGFRIESKVFPRLQGMGSDGLFYTQDQVRSIIDYARDRGIRVYPEFEMPSHANSFYIGYPELADGQGPYHLKRKFGEKWGRPRKASEDSSMDPTKESTYQFLDRFIGEMSALFPDAYWHIGGDAEDAITEWATNANIQKYVREHHLKDNAALQAYFTERLEKMLAKRHKIAIGWDEVLQPDTPKEIVIQTWRGLDSLALSARSGHRGILSWGYYLDLNEPASRHYTVDPLDKAAAELSPEQQKSILGGETAMWTEYVTPESVVGRIWPRAASVAERLWSPRETKDVNSMYARLAILSQFLTYSGLPYQATREQMYQRMVGSADPTALEVLAGTVEPPKGFPREGDREYTVYTALNHLSDVIPSESDPAREFRRIAARVATGKATLDEIQQIRQWLILWRDNDATLQPMLAQSAVTLELAPVSHNLSQVASIGLSALDALESHRPLSVSVRQKDLALLKALNVPIAELTNMVLPGVEVLVDASH